jgi:hypothetical protein
MVVVPRMIRVVGSITGAVGIDIPSKQLNNIRAAVSPIPRSSCRTVVSGGSV